MGTRGTGADPTYEHSDAFEEEERKEKEGDVASKMQSTVTRLIESANRFYSEELEDVQASATDHYHGRPYGDEEADRSKVVSTDVRDAVEAILPSVMRVLMGREAPVEFMPRKMGQLELARQQTDTINHIVVDREDGFVQLSSIVEDALVRKIGIAKFYAEDAVEVTGERFRNMTIPQITVLLEDEELSLLDAEAGDPIPAVEPTETNPGVPEQPTFNLRVRRTSNQPRVRFEAVPNEEFRYTSARSLEDADCVVHSKDVPVSYLVARGFDREWVLEHGKNSKSDVGQKVYEARQTGKVDRREDTEVADARTTVLFTEAWCRVDGDEDDIAEWRRFECVGSKFKINPDEPEGEIVAGPPFAVFTMRVLAHMIAGLSVDDFLKDTQRIISQVERGVLDSLALALESKEYVWDGKVNPVDVLDPGLLNVVRTFGDPNQVVRVVTHDFIGPAAIPVLEYYGNKQEEKLGLTKASRGLDADSLQSATKQAVAGTLEKAQERIEMIVRSLCETGMKPLFKGLLKLTHQNINRPMVVRIRGKYIEVDPRGWDADLDVVVNVGTGHGSREERIQMLRDIAADQAEHMAAGSPLVTWQHIRNTRERLIRLLGYNDSEEFYSPWGPEEQQAFEQQQREAAQQAAQTPDASMLLVQVEQNKLQLNGFVEKTKLDIERQRLEIERLRIELEDARARDKLDRETALKEYQIDVENDRKVDEAGLKATIEAGKLEVQASRPAPARGGE